MIGGSLIDSEDLCGARILDKVSLVIFREM